MTARLTPMKCKHCGTAFEALAGAVNRAAKTGAPMYCGRACAGLARRSVTPPTPEQKRAAKAAYDRKYKERNADRRRAQRADYYQRTHDPEKEREIRKANMPRHVEYCRRPEYVAWKAAYDLKLRASEYGSFADSYLLLLDLNRELRQQATCYERRVAKGYYTRNAQKRRRELWQLSRKT